MVEVAERQEGLIARRQLLECGMGVGTITRWIERGRLHRRHPGVYALGHRRTTERGRLIAALLYAGPGAALAGLSAAGWWRVAASQPRVVEVATCHRRRSVPGVAVRFRPRMERVMHMGLPAIPITETLLALARSQPRRLLRRALAEADYLGLLDPDAVEAAMGRGRPGSAALRGALAEHLPQLAHTRSELEVRFLGICERVGLPLPELNASVGPFAVDVLWREQRLVAELDGGNAHGRPAAVVRDRDRELLLRELGYRIVRYSWRQVCDDPGRVVADLDRALSGGYPSSSL